MKKIQNKKRERRDILELLADFKFILIRKPTYEEMYNQVRMMRFKIKPLQGDISVFNAKNNRLIEVLWSLGKLDEVYQKRVLHLDATQREIFFRVFDDVYHKLQGELNQINLKSENIRVDSPTPLEMEIFKEYKNNKKLN